MNRKFPKKEKKQKKFQSSDDYINAAIEEEDHGDRWISTDLPKGLRFYQRSFDLYLKGLEQGDSDLNNDALYNIARMQFVIYNKVIKPGHWPDISDKFQNGPNSVITEDITKIVENHRQLLTRMGNGNMDNVGIDVLFNFGQVLTEAGDDQRRLDWLIEAKNVFQHVLDRQKAELLAILNGEGIIDDQNDDQSNTDDSDGPIEPMEPELTEKSNKSVAVSQYVTQIETVTPDVVLDTLVAIIECITSLIDNLEESNEETRQLYQETCQYAQNIISQIQELLDMKLPENFMLEPSARNEALIAIASYRSSLIQYEGRTNPTEALKQLMELWNNDQLQSINTKHRYLTQASSFMEFAEIFNLNQSHGWNSLAHAAKVMQQGVQSIGRSSPNTPELGQLYLMWGDIEYQRSRYELEVAGKNRDLLMKNSITLYGNVVSLQSLSSDVVPLQREASIKMSIVQGTGPPPTEIPNYLKSQLIDMGMMLLDQ